jgi:MtN3 and saliva related transmembrane protein
VYLTAAGYLCIGFLVLSKRRERYMNSIQLLGLFAGTLTTAAFLPQVIKTWKSRSAKDLSLGMFSLFCLGVMLWLVYGIMVRDIPVIAANLVTLMLASTLLVFKLRFKNQ